VTYEYQLIINTQLTQQMVGAYLMLFQLISRTVNLLLHKINSTNFISQKFSDSAAILAISVSKRCALDVTVSRRKDRLLDFCFFYHSAIPEKFSLTILSLHVLTLG